MSRLHQYLIRYHLWAVRRHASRLTTEQLCQIEGFEQEQDHEVLDHGSP